MVSITCYGGVRTIGGNKLILRDGETHLSFDFGTSYAERYWFFEEYLNPRPGVGLRDLLFTRLIPPLGGIYREDLFPDEGLKGWLSSQEGYRELELAGVLLSHAHLDHSGYISFLRTDIPIYATAMTTAIAKAVQDSTQGNFEKEVCYARPREGGEGVLTIPRRQPYRRRPFVLLGEDTSPAGLEAFWDYSPVTSGFEPAQLMPSAGGAGGLPIRHFPVDHSLFGACALGVETSRGWVLHTGDLRLHGGASPATYSFVEEARNLRPRALLCEGTRIGDRRQVTEAEVYDHALEVVQATNGLVIADFGPRNVERLISFLSIAHETGRKLVILGRDAYLLAAMRSVSAAVPDLAANDDILIYQDMRVRLSTWERELLRRYQGKLISGGDVGRQQSELLLCFSFWDIINLIDIQPQDAIYIYSSSEAFSEEQRMDLERLRHWLRLLEVRFVGDPAEQGEERFHASGHASGPELLEIVREIRPQMLIPIHTEQPELFAEELAGEGIEVRIPILGQEIEL